MLFEYVKFYFQYSKPAERFQMTIAPFTSHISTSDVSTTELQETRGS